MKLTRRNLKVLIESMLFESSGNMTPILQRIPVADGLMDMKDGPMTMAVSLALGSGYWQFVGSRSEYSGNKDTVMIAYGNDMEKAKQSHRAKLKKLDKIDKNWVQKEEMVKLIAAAYDADNNATGGKLDEAMQKEVGMLINKIKVV